jgi:hypothetical protein
MAGQTADTPNTLVNLGEIATFNFKVVENSPPNSIFSKLLNTAGVQTTPQMARGYVKGSIIDFLNGQTAHVCDFKFIFPDLGSIIGELGLVSPVAAIKDAIKNAKLKAANRLRSMVQMIVTGLRTVLDAVVFALGFDVTGVISFNFSLLKKIVRQINAITKKIAMVVEAVLEWVFLAQQIVQLINWIKTLPAKLQQMLKDCLTQFGNSITQVATQIKSIPEQIASLSQTQITNIASEFTAAAKLTLDTVTSTQTSSSIPDGVVQAFNQPLDSHVDTIQQYIMENTPSSDDLKANTTSTKMANTSRP